MAMRSNIKCTYVNETGEQLIFTSGRASPYFINDIDGISSVDNTLYTFKGSGQHGETVTGMTLTAYNHRRRSDTRQHGQGKKRYAYDYKPS